MSIDTLARADERVKSESVFAKLMKRPELGAIGGVVLVTLFFMITADSTMFTLSGVMNFMTPAAQLGILGIAAAMLMIGASSTCRSDPWSPSPAWSLVCLSSISACRSLLRSR